MRAKFRSREHSPDAIRVEYVFRNGETSQSVFLPGRLEVCSRCRGHGKHVNPAIDGNGISPEEFAEDPDFEEGYFSGRYDVRCEECDGEKVLPEIDHKRLTKFERVLASAHEERLARNARWDAEDQMTRRWESGAA